jgi:hypothetical protein
MMLHCSHENVSIFVDMKVSAIHCMSGDWVEVEERI